VAIAPIAPWICPWCGTYYSIHIMLGSAPDVAYIIVFILWRCRESHNIVCSTAYIRKKLLSMTKCIHPNTVIKIKNESYFVHDVRHGIYYDEVDVLHHRRLPLCTINKAHKQNYFFCQNVQMSQLSTHKLSQTKTQSY